MSLMRRKMTPDLLAANRANAAKSLGPTSERGKLRSRLNALKHWGRSEGVRPHLAALGEDAADFDTVRRGLYRSLAPRDEFEAMLVDDMADIRWRLGRLIRAEAAAQGRHRLEKKLEQAERDAAYDAGKLHDLDRFILEGLGYFGLHDSPAKFDHILNFLKAIAIFVHEEGFCSEGVAYLQTIYGSSNEGARPREMIALYKKAAKEQQSQEPDAARLQSARKEFQGMLREEISWWEQRAAVYHQTRADLKAPRTDSEMLYAPGGPLNTVLCAEALERMFERKWFLLLRYREVCRVERELAAQEIQEESGEKSEAEATAVGAGGSQPA